MQLGWLFSFSLLASGSVRDAVKVHRVVIDMDVSGRVALANVLETATNVKKALAPDTAKIEVVCHGSGLDLLFATHNPVALRVRKLEIEGVTFVACANTMHGRHVTTKELLPGVVVVDSGAAELVRKQEAGWAYLKSE